MQCCFKKKMNLKNFSFFFLFLALLSFTLKSEQTNRLFPLPFWMARVEISKAFVRKEKTLRVIEVCGEETERLLEAYVRPLFREYVKYLNIDLDFQGFEEELKELPGIYAPDHNGTIIVALEEFDGKEPVAAGVVALKKLEEGISEMKRLYLRDEYRGYGIGKDLMLLIIEKAKSLGYEKIRWDTLARLKEAGQLYAIFDAKEIEAYNYNPFPDVMYFELSLDKPPLKQSPQ